MIITSQGFGHFTQGMNNQDFGIESEERMLLILDGCSAAKYSEIGTRLFAQLFSRKEEWDNVEKFEDNVKEVFEDILDMMTKYYKSYDELESEFIMENLLFTIIACFKLEDRYVVKLFGDGYIFTKNARDAVSYMKFTYGKCPPYLAYRYCNSVDPSFKNYDFKTFTFEKGRFPIVGIGTDGIMPIAKGDIAGADTGIVTANDAFIRVLLNGKKADFLDDVTIGVFGGEK